MCFNSNASETHRLGRSRVESVRSAPSLDPRNREPRRGLPSAPAARRQHVQPVLIPGALRRPGDSTSPLPPLLTSRLPSPSPPCRPPCGPARRCAVSAFCASLAQIVIARLTALDRAPGHQPLSTPVATPSLICRGSPPPHRVPHWTPPLVCRCLTLCCPSFLSCCVADCPHFCRHLPSGCSPARLPRCVSRGRGCSRRGLLGVRPPFAMRANGGPGSRL